jgi:predicted  nucleic acid-binding Zn-ribbon protein
MNDIDKILCALNDKIMIHEEELEFLYEANSKIDDFEESIEFCKKEISKLRDEMADFMEAVEKVKKSL